MENKMHGCPSRDYFPGGKEPRKEASVCDGTGRVLRLVPVSTACREDGKTILLVGDEHTARSQLKFDNVWYAFHHIESGTHRRIFYPELNLTTTNPNSVGNWPIGEGQSDVNEARPPGA
jgi:hypothetical protein